MLRLDLVFTLKEALQQLIEGKLASGNAKSELVRLATRLIIEEGLEAEVRDALGRGYYEHGAEAGTGHRSGAREGRLKIAEGFIRYVAPRSPARQNRTVPNCAPT